MRKYAKNKKGENPMVKLIKVIDKQTYKGKDNKEHNYTSYKIVADNGNTVAILPNTKYDDDARIKLNMLVDEIQDNRNR